MFRKIINFFKNYDIRWKLIKVSKILKINIYPKHFKFNGLNSLYSYLIYNLIYNDKFSKTKKETFDFIKTNVNFKSSKINFLISTQSSGSNFLRGMLNSYFEMKYGLGNGIPFYNIATDRWIYNGPIILFSDFWKVVNLERNIKLNKLNSELKKNFLEKRIIFTRHPIVKIDLFDLNKININPIVLLREPKDWIISRYLYLEKNEYYCKFDIADNEVNNKIIEDEFSKLCMFIDYWKSFLNKKKNYLLIDYENLINDPFYSLKKSLEFYGFNDINEEYLKKSLKYNSKDFINEFYGNLNMKRFSNKDNKSQIKGKIENYVEDYMKKNLIREKYNEILELKK